MTTYYVDPSSASEASPYDTWAKAAHALATVVAIPPAAGDIIYCRKSGGGTGETIAAEIDIASGGSNTTGWIKIIGCNASGVVDGTRYVITSGTNNIHHIDFAGYDMWWLENIEVVNGSNSSGKYGFYSSAASSSGCVFINCCANGIASTGFYLSNITYSLFLRCVAYGCTNGFTGSGGSCNIICSCSRDNTGDGFNSMALTDRIIGSISHSNSDDGFGSQNPGGLIMNCAINDNEDDGIELGTSSSNWSVYVIGTRITTNTDAAINASTQDEPVVTGWVYFEDNAHTVEGGTYWGEISSSSAPLTSGSLVTGTAYRINHFVTNDDFTNVGAASNADGIKFIATGTTPTHWEHGSEIHILTSKAGLANTNQGYVDATEGSPDLSTNYTSASDPTTRRDAITIPYS